MADNNVEVEIKNNLVNINKLLEETAEKLKKLGDATESLKGVKEDINNAKNETTKWSETLDKGLTKALAGAQVMFLAVIKASKTFRNVTNETQAAMNRVNLIMGDNAEEAQKFASRVQSTLGIRAADFLRFQSTIYQSATTMGLAADNALIMSQNITQLAYDMAGLMGDMNNVDNYLSALQNGLTGNAKQLRNMGFALTEADLKQEALLEGLDVNVRNLNAASKAMLRYNAIIRQSESYQNGYINNFMTMGTAQAILSAQVKELSNAIGQLLYPIVMKVMPYVIAFVQALTYAVKMIADLLNIELPTIDPKPITTNMNKIADEAEATGKAIKKSFTLGIDELNVLESATDSAGSGLGGMDITNQIAPLSYDFFAGYEGSNAQKFMEGIEEKVEALKPLFNGLSTMISGAIDAISNWVDNSLYPWLVSVGEWMDAHPDTLETLGHGLGYVAVALTTFGLLGGLSKLIGIPTLVTGLEKVYKWIAVNYLALLKITSVALLIFLGVSLIGEGVKDLIQNGVNKENLAVIYGGILAIAVAVMLVNFNLGIVVGGVLLVLATFLIFADKVTGAISWVIGAITNVFIALMNVAAYIGAMEWQIIKIIANLVITIWTATENVGIFFKNLGSGIAGVLEASATNIKNAFVTMWDYAQIKALDFQETVLKVIQKVAQKANDLLGVFGVQIDTTGIETQLQNLRDKKSNLEGEISKIENADLVEAFKEGFKSWDYAKFTDRWLEVKGSDVDAALETYGYLDLDEVYKKGAELGSNAQDYWLGKLGDLFDADKPLIPEDTQNALLDTNKVQEEIANMTKDFSIDTQNIDKILGEDVLTNQMQSNLAIADVEEAIISETDKAQKIAENTDGTLKTIGDKIDAVRDACENIEINVYNGLMAEGYAGGGFPTSARLFFANEDGTPELVGRVGNRTVVVNNDQIFQGIYQAVSAGMANMSQQPIEVTSVATLDGEVIYRNQQKVASRKGYSMGGGAFAHV